MKHVTFTGSRYAEGLLADWASVQRRIVKVMPREYKRALAEQANERLRSRQQPVVDTIGRHGRSRRAAIEDAGTAVHG